MNAITSFFLRAKHWQLFLLIFGTYCVGEFWAMKSIVTAQPAVRTGGLVSCSGFLWRFSDSPF